MIRKFVIYNFGDTLRVTGWMTHLARLNNSVSMHCQLVLSWMLYIKTVVIEVGETEQSKEVCGVFQVVGEQWDETLMKSVGSTELASEKEDARVNASAVDTV